MQVIVGGKFEAALIHELDEINRPERNRTTHPYYLGLNRKPDRLYFERLSTFLAIAEDIVVPVADWSDAAGPTGIAGTQIGLLAQTGGLNEWDPGAKQYAEHIFSSGVLSASSARYIMQVDLSSLGSDDKAYVEKEFSQISADIAVHYLCRLLLQVREAGMQRCQLILDEADIVIITEISRYALRTGHLPPFPFPDLDEKVILGCDFAGGIFNFAPRDMRSVAAIRGDSEVQRYASKVRSVLGKTFTLSEERDLLDAMRSSYKAVALRQKVDKAFEVIGWIAKPLHYIPGVDAALSVAEDVMDVGDFLLDKERETREWYLLAVRATQVNVEEYLKRKENL